MSNIIVPVNDTGNSLKLSSFAAVAGGTIMSMSLAGVTSVQAKFGGAAAAADSLSGDMSQLRLKTNLANAFSISGVSFSSGGKKYTAKANGDIQTDLSPITGSGTKVGTLSPQLGEVTLDSWVTGAAPAVGDWRGVAGAPINGATTPFNTYAITFRIASAPIRTGTFSVLGTMQDGTTFNYTADSNGYINQPRVKGRINYTTGVVTLVGVTPSAPAGAVTADLSFLGIPGVTTGYIDLIRQETLRYNATAFTYLPLDATLLGIDPVRLPSDGRVPIFRPGELAVVGHTATTTPSVVANDQTVSVGRTRLSRLRVLGNDNHVIVNGYTEDLEAGTVTFTNVTGYSQPVRIEHRIEDMGLIRDVQIDGTITFTRQLTHDYPLENTYISSALRTGDLNSRMPLMFDQGTWDGITFSDVLVGAAAPGTYNIGGYPMVLTNAGTVTERWALRFKTTQTFDIIGEHVGTIGEGSINTLTAPLNPATGVPYWQLLSLGFGGGWSVGSVIRFNTVGAMFPVWMIRTVQQGPEAAADYSFTTIVRGDVDNPLV